MSMYIYANLPETYGAFNQIREDNYPFNRIFTEYLKVLAKLANTDDMNIYELLGHVENELMGGDRLPDLPNKNIGADKEERVNFRYPIEDELVKDFYKSHDVTNKMITQLIIRTTIRLSEVYGTSLLRLIALISDIGKSQTKSQTKAPAAKVGISKPVKEPAKQTKVDNKDDKSEKSKADLLKMIEELTKKGSDLVQQTNQIGIGAAEERDVLTEGTSGVDDDADDDDTDDGVNDDTDEDNSGKVVKTNPNLKFFI